MTKISDKDIQETKVEVLNKLHETVQKLSEEELSAIEPYFGPKELIPETLLQTALQLISEFISTAKNKKLSFLAAIKETTNSDHSGTLKGIDKDHEAFMVILKIYKNIITSEIIEEKGLLPSLEGFLGLSLDIIGVLKNDEEKYMVLQHLLPSSMISESSIARSKVEIEQIEVFDSFLSPTKQFDEPNRHPKKSVLNYDMIKRPQQFDQLENILIEKQYLDLNYNWLKPKRSLKTFIHALKLNDFFPKHVEYSNRKVIIKEFHIERYIEARYNLPIKGIKLDSRHFDWINEILEKEPFFLKKIGPH